MADLNPAPPTTAAAAGEASTALAVDAFLAAVLAGRMEGCSAYSDDVVLDATVPNWRFTVRGADAVRAEYARWFADPGRFESLRRLPHPGGEVVDYTLTWEELGVTHVAHHMHLLEVVDGRIVADTVLCGGRWSASLVAEMAAAGGENGGCV